MKNDKKIEETGAESMVFLNIVINVTARYELVQ